MSAVAGGGGSEAAANIADAAYISSSDSEINPPLLKRGPNDVHPPNRQDLKEFIRKAVVADAARAKLKLTKPDASVSVPFATSEKTPLEVLANDAAKSNSIVETGDMFKNAIDGNPQIKETLTNMAEKMVHMQLKQLQQQEKISQDEVNELDKLFTEYGFKLILGNEHDSESIMSKTSMTKALISENQKILNKVRKATVQRLDASQLSQIFKSSNNINAMVVLRDYVISKTGRENGPDIALKVMPSINDSIYSAFKDIINKNSSITEVMNVLAFLLNNSVERRESIVKEFSIDSGTHDSQGKYTNIPNTQNPSDLLSVFDSLTGGDRPFDISILKVYSSEASTIGNKLPKDTIILPAGILKRDSKNYEVKPRPIDRNDIPKVISACVLQMVNILENTRQVFGGWAKLFKGMQGGSSKPKNKSKKTRRRYRRRN